jgi:hypothetical protein
LQRIAIAAQVALLIATPIVAVAGCAADPDRV